jgi:membrane protease subunit HflK
LGQVAQFEKLLPEYQAAPDVTRDRLYLDTMEQVYTSTSKVLIDSESSGNLLYLPMDKLGQSVSGSSERKSSTTSTYDDIELESQRTDTDVAPSTNRSTSTRQGRY